MFDFYYKKNRMLVIDPKSRADAKNLIRLILLNNGLKMNIQNQDNLLFVINVMKNFPTNYSESDDYTLPNVYENRKSNEEVFNKLDKQSVSTSTTIKFEPASSILKIDPTLSGIPKKLTQVRKNKRYLRSNFLKLSFLNFSFGN